jgi:hypothetical protein
MLEHLPQQTKKVMGTMLLDSKAIHAHLSGKQNLHNIIHLLLLRGGRSSCCGCQIFEYGATEPAMLVYYIIPSNEGAIATAGCASKSNFDCGRVGPQVGEFFY